MQASTPAARKSRSVSQPFTNRPISTLFGNYQRHCCTMGAMAALLMEEYKGQEVSSWKLVHDLGPLCSPFGVMVEEIRSKDANVESEDGSEVVDHCRSDENDVSYDSEQESDSISLFSSGSSVITTSTTNASSSIETKLDLLISDMASLTVRGILSETDGAELEETRALVTSLSDDNCALAEKVQNLEDEISKLTQDKSALSLRVEALESLFNEKRALVGKVHILESKLATLLQEKRELERSNRSEVALLMKKETEILNLRYAVSWYKWELEDARQLADERGACFRELLDLGRAEQMELLQRIDVLRARDKRRRDAEEASRASITISPSIWKHSGLPVGHREGGNPRTPEPLSSQETVVELLPGAYALIGKDARPDNEKFHVRKQNRRHSR